MRQDSADNKISPEDKNPSPPKWSTRVGWLVLIWSLSVLSLGIVAFAIKKFMLAAGMTT